MATITVDLNKKVSFSVTQGETFYRRLTVSDGTNPIDLSTATITGSIKRRYSQIIPDATFTVTAIDLAAGQFSLSLSSSTTANLTVPKAVEGYVFEVVFTWPGGTVNKWLKGFLNVNRQVS